MTILLITFFICLQGQDSSIQITKTKQQLKDDQVLLS